MLAGLGEEIQPVREIPCSGTVTILKYGTQKRVICRYKDGQEAEIPFNDYQLKATISEAAALGSVSDEPANSQLEEIVFEHPDLELCRSGVEIVDSPGLNEHPERTTITQKLLKDTDAAIFLTNASRSLTQGERDLLQDLKNQLNFSKENEPANNLFVVCNFMDLVKTEKGREQVQQRVIRFVQGENPIVAGENRIHFISAQAALDAILQGNEDEYLQAFQNFTQSIEKFLTSECGQIKIQRSVNEINCLIQKVQDELHKAETVLAEKQKILEQIGEASGRNLKIRIFANQLRDKVIDEAIISWNEWLKRLRDRMAEKSKNWSSEHNPVWSQDKLIQDYIKQFRRDLLKEIDDWYNTRVKDGIVLKKLSILDDYIKKSIKAIQAQFKNTKRQVNPVVRNIFELFINDIDDDFSGFKGFGGGLGIGGALAAGLFAFTGVGLVAIIVASVGAATAGSVGLGMLDVDGIKHKIKKKVLKIGLQNLSSKKASEKIRESIRAVFESRVESVSEQSRL
ncbi:MAG: dynamin family protein [Nostocaceae cyanobacterium]|nr:dynamin family protein [Nostocaceae cyanobacterium]